MQSAAWYGTVQRFVYLYVSKRLRVKIVTNQ